MIKFGLLILFFIFSTASSLAVENNIHVPKGQFKPFFKESIDRDIDIPDFYLNTYPVTNQEFNEFLILNKEFRKSNLINLYADQRYLKSWSADLLTVDELKKIGQQPVTNVSWFVARKYCASKNQRLPTIAEWEYASDSTNPKIIEQLLTWYAKTGDHQIENIGQKKPNKFGLHDMHGLIWELVEDFSSVMISSDSRSKGDRTDGQFCGGGSVNATDSTAYATFMRYAIRSGFRGDYCMKNLGFRCASNTESSKK